MVSSTELKQDKGEDEATIVSSDMDLPEAMRNHVLGFVCRKWNPDSDVSTWNVEEMKADWDR